MGHAGEAYFAAELSALSAAKMQGRFDHLTRVDDHTCKTEPSAALKAAQHHLRAQLHRLAFRISENRVVAGLHYPIDAIAGQWIGVLVAAYS